MTKNPSNDLFSSLSLLRAVCFSEGVLLTGTKDKGKGVKRAP